MIRLFIGFTNYRPHFFLLRHVLVLSHGWCGSTDCYDEIVCIKSQGKSQTEGIEHLLPLLKVTIKPLTSSNNSKIKRTKNIGQTYLQRHFAAKKLTFCTQSQPLHHKLWNVNTAIVKKLDVVLARENQKHEQRRSFFSHFPSSIFFTFLYMTKYLKFGGKT